MNAWVAVLTAGLGTVAGLQASAQPPDAGATEPTSGAERALHAPLEVRLAPYVWALSLKGHSTVKGIKADVDVDFDDILQHLNGAVMLEAEVRKGSFGLLFNTLYANLYANEDFADDRIKIKARANQLIQGVAVTYRIGTWKLVDLGEDRPLTLTVDPYVGARFTYLQAELKGKLDLPDFGISRKRTVDEDKSWTDPVIGLRTIWRLGDRWTATLAGDIGGTDTHSQYSYQGIGVVGYRFGLFAERDAALFAGYRVLHQKFSDGDGRNQFEWDITMHGPLLALSVAF